MIGILNFLSIRWIFQLTRPITFGSYANGILVGDLDSTVQSIVTGWADGNVNFKF